MTNRIAAGALLLMVGTGAPYAAQDRALFSEPLHVTREIVDPISKATHAVDEYYAGDRVVTVAGDRIVVADYAAGTLTEIDRGAGTWSVASFEEIAAARRELVGSRGSSASETRIEPRQVAPRTVAGTMAETLVAEFSEGELRRVEVSLSPVVSLSAEALEVVSGAAYPNEPGRASLATVALAKRPDKGVRSASPAGARYGLPVRQVLEFEVDGERLVMENRVVRVGNETAPAEMLTIPTDARRVEPHLIEMRRLAEELDRLPGVEENRRP